MSNTVQLVSSDGRNIPVPRVVCEKQSMLLKELLQDNDDDNVELPVSCVRGDVLQKMVDFMAYHTDHPAKELPKPMKENFFDIVEPWDKAFMEGLDHAFVFDLLTGANFLNAKELLEMCCARIAEWIKEKSVEEIRDMFGIENDFTPEEEEKLRKEHGIEKL
eukprot:PhM_4_TR13041/c0_g3_i1/m.88347/K03094/SKP1, CBF3D; S-phase kinase-associated protein 1